MFKSAAKSVIGPGSRTLLAACIAAAVAAATLVAPAVANAGVKVGMRAPELVGAKDAHGRTVRLRALRGKWVVLTFGASWCKPCKKELPAYEKLAKKYKGANVTDVVFLAVNIDGNLAKGKKFVKRSGLSAVRVAFDPTGSTAKNYDPPTTPSTYIVDPRGVVRLLHRGYHKGDEKKIATFVDSHRKK